jgi:putative redox protein
MRAVARRRDGYTHDVEIEGGHSIVIDEPAADGGNDLGSSPTRLLAASLAACTAITMEMYADRKGMDLGELEVVVDMEYGEKSKPRSFEVILRLPSSLSDEQVEKLRVIAGKCPVQRVLEGGVEVTERVERV